MKVKEITVGTARKLGLPGYSSLDVSAFVTVTLENGDIPADAYKRAWDTIEEQVIGRIEAKGLESPVAKEAQNPSDPADWLEHKSPEEQKASIKSAKRLKEMETKLKIDSKAVTTAVAVNTVPSVMPTKRGGD